MSGMRKADDGGASFMIEDPDGRTRVRKADDIANDAAEAKDRARGA